MIDHIVNTLLKIYINYETTKIAKRTQKSKKNILPNYILKRQIKILNNGEIVFDSKKVDKIPLDIQYTIKSYGIPKKIKFNSKTPIVYNVNTTLSSIFPNEAIEARCIESKNEIAI